MESSCVLTACGAPAISPCLRDNGPNSRDSQYYLKASQAITVHSTHDWTAAAQALSQAVAQSGCGGTAVAAEAFFLAQAAGKGQAFAQALASANAGNVQSCIPAESG